MGDIVDLYLEARYEKLRMNDQDLFEYKRKLEGPEEFTEKRLQDREINRG